MDPSTFGVTPDLARPAIDGVEAKLLLSVAVVLASWLIRGILSWLTGRGEGPLTDRARWWFSLLKNLTVVAGLGALIALWSQEIGDAALSLTAFAVAMVIATKELILCLSGAVWRGLARPFGVGDWIDLGPFSGVVIDESLLSTELQEIDPVYLAPTGRTVSAPNSLLLTTPLVNHGFRKRFLPLTVEIVEEPHPEHRAASAATRARIAAAVEAASADFAEVARRYAARIEKSSGVRLPDPAPTVTMDTNELGKIVYRVRVFCPRERAADIRDAAVTAFLARP
jgi:small-conductance mechanosensitive channel